ncbi:NUDIX domain-containing protein [Acetobacteraceae bacterium KSS8]|uniref:NUDIX domain-containing protein n=1 Tax=Endosaccharibacter trunci TaxID=2812733 RepID=A0ABT1W5M4_9PROT|nr:NUDIX domain-containing protein [Acetobacteraceae bacterium KSS8]
MNVIRIAAALLLRADNQTLLVRKRGTRAFMQPGGKIDPGETAEAALVRELREELGISIDPAALEPLGDADADAANEPGCRVAATLFALRWDGPVMPAAEIEEARWVDPASPGALELAPLTRGHVLPLAGGMR